MTLKLLGSKILVKPVQEEKQTASGLVLPASINTDKVRKGTVANVGNGDRQSDGKRVEMEVKINDSILYEYSEYATKEVSIDGEKYFLIDERDVIGIF